MNFMEKNSNFVICRVFNSCISGATNLRFSSLCSSKSGSANKYYVGFWQHEKIIEVECHCKRHMSWTFIRSFIWNWHFRWRPAHFIDFKNLDKEQWFFIDEVRKEFVKYQQTWRNWKINIVRGKESNVDLPDY